MAACGIKIEERANFVEKGCCHGSVEQVFQNLLKENSLKEMISQIDPKTFEEWKKEMCNSVSLECMENAKTEIEIEDQLKKIISLKFSSF
jgi:hypothetical protein